MEAQSKRDWPGEGSWGAEGADWGLENGRGSQATCQDCV